MNGEAPQPFNNPFSMANNPFMNRPTGGGMGMPQNVDKMIADIEKRIKEIDEEEERRKKLKEQEKKNLFLDSKQAEMGNIVETKKEEKIEEKPKVNVDVDSIIVNENVISDDEFFDDFFGDDN